MSKPRNPTSFVIEIEQRDEIRNALLCGLALLGEFKERRDAWKVLELTNRPAPDTLKPIDPIGRADDVSIFASALRDIQTLEVRS